MRAGGGVASTGVAGATDGDGAGAGVGAGSGLTASTVSSGSEARRGRVEVLDPMEQVLELRVNAGGYGFDLADLSFGRGVTFPSLPNKDFRRVASTVRLTLSMTSSAARASGGARGRADQGRRVKAFGGAKGETEDVEMRSATCVARRAGRGLVI